MLLYLQLWRIFTLIYVIRARISRVGPAWSLINIFILSIWFRFFLKFDQLKLLSGILKFRIELSRNFEWHVVVWALRWPYTQITTSAGFDYRVNWVSPSFPLRITNLLLESIKIILIFIYDNIGTQFTGLFCASLWLNITVSI